jgi:hypothetical protein
MPKGRPRKAGNRTASGQLSRAGGKIEAPPANVEAFEVREVVDGGQVIGQAYRRRCPMDAVACNRSDVPCVDGDQWRALKAYADAWAACTVSGRSAIDMTPSGGGGIEAVIDARRGATTRFAALHGALPPHFAGVVSAVCVQGVPPHDFAGLHSVTVRRVYEALAQAGDCLMAVLVTTRKAA